MAGFGGALRGRTQAVGRASPALPCRYQSGLSHESAGRSRRPELSTDFVGKSVDILRRILTSY
jgi:hypothetical protein